MLSKVRTQAFTATASLLRPASSNRSVLVFYPHSTYRYTVGNDSNVADGQGITVPTGGGPVQVSLKEDGDVVRRPWWVIAESGASGTLGFIEGIGKAGCGCKGGCR